MLLRGEECCRCPASLLCCVNSHYVLITRCDCGKTAYISVNNSKHKRLFYENFSARTDTESIHRVITALWHCPSEWRSIITTSGERCYACFEEEKGANSGTG